MKRVLVTGASGFIGHHLVNRLIRHGVQTRCLVRPTSWTENIHPDAELCIGRIGDPESLVAATQGVDTVIHLAGLTKSNRREDLWRVNEIGTRNMARACADQASPPTLIVVSSLAAAGPVVREHRLRPRKESDAPAPVSDYGRSKLDGEAAAREFVDSVPISILRPPMVLGPLDRDGLEMFKVISRLRIHAVPGFGPSLFSVIDARDLATALLSVAEVGRRCKSTALDDETGVYFAADPNPLTFAQLGRTVGNAVGRPRAWCIPVAKPLVRLSAGVNEVVGRIKHKPHIFNWDKAREAIAAGWACDSFTIKAECGFEVRTDLQTRINETAAWYREAGWL